MKKILFVSHEKYKNGSTYSMITLIKELKRDYGYEIEVLLPSYGSAIKLLQDNGIPYRVFYYFGNWRVISRKKIFREFIKEFINCVAVGRLILKLKRKNYDYVISNSSAVDVGARASVIANVKHLYYIREFMEEDFSFEYRNKKRMKKLLEYSNKIIFISKAVADKYINRYRMRSYRVIYNGIIPENYLIENHKILEREELRLIQVGALSDAKGAKKSIEFISNLSKTVKCHLTLAGNGSEEYIRELCKYIDNNQLNEYISIESYSDNVKALFQGEDILLTNSKSEGFGRVTVEGMLGGLLAVGKNAGGTKEIITNGKTGILFENCDDFIHIMNDINNNRLLYREIALKGQAYALQKFKPAQNAKDVEAYLREK